VHSLRKYLWVIFLIAAALLLMGADSGEQGTDERAKLLEQQKQLNARVETLKQEQDYLLFQKTMYASDSKYLVINISARTGQLKYKNRVLKDFHFTSAGPVSMLKQGSITLTKKIEGTKERHSLIFGSSLVLLSKRTPATPLEAGIPRIYLSRKDFLPLYYSLEIGALSYIVR
jgi:hypothetical protein